jgi:hypothetical protein
MHCLNLKTILFSLTLAATLTGVASAGPTLACHTWAITPGSTFEALEPLRSSAMYSDDDPAHGKAALAKIATLRAEAKSGEPLALLKAGYWISVLHDVRIAPDSDGRDLIRRAAEARLNDPEYQFFAALAYFDTDQSAFKQYWAKAQELAKPGSVTEQNIRLFEPELAKRLPRVTISEKK